MFILLRHAEAMPLSQMLHADDGASDSVRYLTARGRLQANEAGTALRSELGFTGPVRVVASPLTRTVQTAELLSVGAVEAASVWHVDASVHAAIGWMSRQHSTDTVVIVGHEPLLSAVYSQLTGKPERPFDLCEHRVLSSKETSPG